MNKKPIITILLALVLLIGGSMGVSYYRSFKPVSITIPRRGVSITVYNAADKRAGSLPGSGKLSLRAGEYSVVPAGGNISTEPIPLTVTKNGAYLVVDPGYSTAYLSTLLTNELPSIAATLNTRYDGAMSGFTLNKGTLYQYGDWYATTLIQASPGPGASGDVYRTVLHKVNDAWEIAATPAIVLNTKDNPTVPLAILTDINSQSGY